VRGLRDLLQLILGSSIVISVAQPQGREAPKAGGCLTGTIRAIEAAFATTTSRMVLFGEAGPEIQPLKEKPP
jgi:hypothetical protein